MIRKAFGLMVVCASGTLALLLLSSILHFGLVWGAAPQQQQARQTPPATSGEARKTIHLVRAPERTIQDTNSSFSAVAVDVVQAGLALAKDKKLNYNTALLLAQAAADLKDVKAGETLYRLCMAQAAKFTSTQKLLESYTRAQR